MNGVQKEPSMNAVQIDQKSYEMPPREGISIAQFLTVADIERSARYYEKVFGARILSLGDGNAPAYLQLANIWMIRVGDAERYRRLIRGRPAPNVQNPPDIRELKVPWRVAVTQAQNASTEDLFVVASRPLDVGDGE